MKVKSLENLTDIQRELVNGLPVTGLNDAPRWQLLKLVDALALEARFLKEQLSGAEAAVRMLSDKALADSSPYFKIQPRGASVASAHANRTNDTRWGHK